MLGQVTRTTDLDTSFYCGLYLELKRKSSKGLTLIESKRRFERHFQQLDFFRLRPLAFLMIIFLTGFPYSVSIPRFSR